MMGWRERMVGGDEYDAFTGWRRVCIWRAGERARIKRAFRRRVRRLAKMFCRSCPDVEVCDD